MFIDKENAAKLIEDQEKAKKRAEKKAAKEKKKQENAEKNKKMANGVANNGPTPVSETTTHPRLASNNSSAQNKSSGKLILSKVHAD